MRTPDDVTVADIRAARERLAGIAVRTPLVRLDVPGLDADVWLKLENLQPIGSFKLRGAANAMLLAGTERVAHGVYTASAGDGRAVELPCGRQARTDRIDMGSRCQPITGEDRLAR